MIAHMRWADARVADALEHPGIDEAVRLADHIAIMRDGRLVQFDSPERILAYPNDDFVADFVGSQRAIKRLSLAPVTDALGPVPDAPFAASVRVGCSLRDALGKILETGERLVCVEDANGVVIGSVSIDDIVSRFARPLS
jgi:osmoprotectant transport system ATP-binding protein